MGFLDDLCKIIKAPPAKPPKKISSKAPPAPPVRIQSAVPSVPRRSLSLYMPELKNGIELFKAPGNTVHKLKDYYVVDVETTGLNPRRDRIVEIAWVKVQNSVIVDTFTTLVNPECSIPADASRVNRIYDTDVATAPKYAEIRQRVEQELVGATVIGHNVTFDLNFIRYLLGETDGRIVYVDTLALAKRIFPELTSYKLENLCKSLHLSQQSTHRALQDVLSTKDLFDACTVGLLRKQDEDKAKRKAAKEAVQQERLEKFRKSPLFDVSFVFTGDFGMDCTALEELAKSVGAIARNTVTMRTDYLVVGKIANLSQTEREEKLGKADKLITKGCKIKKISKAQYLDIIAEAERALRM